MSRHTIPALIPDISVELGWDSVLMTFFAQVVRDQDDDDEIDPMLLWLGTTPNEIARAEDLAGALEPYAILTSEHIEQLRADRAESLDQGPTPLQRQTLAHDPPLAVIQQ